MAISNRLRALLVGVGSLVDLDGSSTRARMQGVRRAHAFGDVCDHGVGFLDECDRCPDGWQPPSDAKAGGAW